MKGAFLCHHMQKHSVLGVVLLLPVTFIYTKPDEADSQSLMLPKWTEWYPWSLGDLALYCD